MHGVVWDLQLETMPFQIARQTQAEIAPVLRIYLHADTATGSGVMQIKEFEFFEVDSPVIRRAMPKPGASRTRLTRSRRF